MTLVGMPGRFAMVGKTAIVDGQCVITINGETVASIGADLVEAGRAMVEAGRQWGKYKRWSPPLRARGWKWHR